MSELISSDPTPQFETAEYAGDDRCAYCHLQIAGTYYRVNGSMTCTPCAEKLKSEAPVHTYSAFTRALLFGSFAALAGMALYAAFAIITGWMIGYVSLAVGYIIAKAMMKGSRGIGGRRYQITAALLTYCAVSMAALPIYIAQEVKKQNEHKQVVAAQQKRASEQKALEQEFGKTTDVPNDNAAADTQAQTTSESTSTASAPQSSPEPAKKMSGAELAKGLALLLAIGLASPFLELASPLHGLIGLVILYVGIQIAWRITAGQTANGIEGPF
jgi:hypothetical protein